MALRFPGERSCRHSTCVWLWLYLGALSLLPHCVPAVALEGERVAADQLLMITWKRDKVSDLPEVTQPSGHVVFPCAAAVAVRAHVGQETLNL